MMAIEIQHQEIKGLENVDVLLLEIPGGGRWVGKTERTKRLRVSKPGV